jgi:small-conductance mechanosensitive channel
MFSSLGCRYVGPLTGSFAIAAIITIIGWIPILLLLPSDETDVYRVGGKLYTPNGEFYKSATKFNFEVRKSVSLPGLLTLSIIVIGSYLTIGDLQRLLKLIVLTLFLP